MKIFICALIVFLAFSGAAFALRCGNDLVNEEDLKPGVVLKCGEPQSKEILGYVDRIEPNRIRVMKIEEWVYKIKERGTEYTYSFIFEGNRLIKIESINK